MRVTYIYYLLLLACFIYSLYFLQDDKVKVLAVLLFLSIGTETFAEINILKNINFYSYYHTFTIVEYGLICGVLFQCIRSRWFKIVLLISIPVFSVASALITLHMQDLGQSPSIASGLEGILLLVWCVKAFYDLEVDDARSVFKQAPFWYILSFFSYYTIVTPYNCIYNTLLADHSFQPRARYAFDIIDNTGNWLLYIFLMKGMSCLRRRNYSQQLLSSR